MRSARPALLTLGAGYFTVGVTLTAPVGIVGPLAASLHVPAPSVAWLVTAFAVVFAVAAPLVQAAAGRLERRHLLVGGLLLLAVGNALTATAPTLAVAATGRAVAALGAAAYGPTALSAGTQLVPPAGQSRALATVFGGISVATVAGVPSVAALAGVTGWRPALVGVTTLALLVAVAVRALVPALGRPDPLPAGGYAAAARTPGVPAGVLTTLLWMAAQFTVYGLASEYLLTRFHAGSGTVAATLLCFGVAGVSGNLVAGRITDRVGAHRVVRAAQALLAVALLALLVLPASAVAAAVAFAVWGFASQLFQTPQQGLLVRRAPASRGLVLALNASALYLGISIGSLASAGVYGATGPRWLPAPALLLLAGAAGLSARARREQPGAPAGDTPGAPAATAAPATA